MLLNIDQLKSNYILWSFLFFLYIN